MADAEDVITVRNLQVEYDRLTHDIPKKASELSLIYKDIEKAKSELADINLQKEASAKECADQLTAVEHAKNSLTQRENDHKEEVRRLETQHKYQTSLTRDATKELERRNAQVLAAGEEYDKYIQLTKDIDEKAAEYVVLLTGIEQAKELLVLLETEKGKILQDISTESEVWEGKLKAARDELSTLVRLAEEKNKEAALAQARVKTYTDELYTHMNDYQVVKGRIETVWKQTFPELELPL